MKEDVLLIHLKPRENISVSNVELINQPTSASGELVVSGENTTFILLETFNSCKAFGYFN